MPNSDQLRWLAQEFSQQFGKALEGMAGQSYAVAWTESTQTEMPNAALWWETPLSYPQGSRISIGAGAASWTQISRTLLEAIGLDTDDASIRSTYVETLAQAVSAMASSLTGRAGKEVTCSAGLEAAAPLPNAGLSIKLTVTIPDAAACDVFALFNPDLVSFFAPKADAPLVTTTGGTMDLLLDVELPVSVSFGRTELALKDVVKLTTGSIVELNRSISEPVEVIVNNCVIARGEVVVIEGNYGVRIDQIITRQERLRTLK